MLKKVFRFVFERQFMRYLFVGVTSVGMDFGTLVLLHGKLNVHLAVATTIAYWLSIAYNFTLNRYWTFSATEKNALYRHLLYYGVLLGFNYLFTVVFVTYVSQLVDYRLAKLLAIACQVTWTYFVYKRVIFVAKDTSKTE